MQAMTNIMAAASKPAAVAQGGLAFATAAGRIVNAATEQNPATRVARALASATVRATRRKCAPPAPRRDSGAAVRGDCEACWLVSRDQTLASAATDCQTAARFAAGIPQGDDSAQGAGGVGTTASSSNAASPTIAHP